MPYTQAAMIAKGPTNDEPILDGGYNSGYGGQGGWGNPNPWDTSNQGGGNWGNQGYGDQGGWGQQPNNFGGGYQQGYSGGPMRANYNTQRAQPYNSGKDNFYYK